jgi:RecG-like helicase
MANLRDLSLMNTAPVGRKEVNVTVGDEDGDVITRAIKAEVARQGQVFVVVPYVRDVAPTNERYLHFNYECVHLFFIFDDNSALHCSLIPNLCGLCIC